MPSINHCRSCGIRLFQGRRGLCPLCEHRRLSDSVRAFLLYKRKEPSSRFKVMSEPDQSLLDTIKDMPICDRQPGFRTSSEFEREDSGVPRGALMGYNKELAMEYWKWLQKLEEQAGGG